MLDFFAVITKGGLVLWYFQDVAQQLKTSIDAINALIRNVVLQVRQGICHSPATLMHIGYLVCCDSQDWFSLLYAVCNYSSAFNVVDWEWGGMEETRENAGILSKKR